jgi:hypothetical protein
MKFFLKIKKDGNDLNASFHFFFLICLYNKEEIKRALAEATASEIFSLIFNQLRSVFIFESFP